MLLAANIIFNLIPTIPKVRTVVEYFLLNAPDLNDTGDTHVQPIYIFLNILYYLKLNIINP